MKGKKATVLTFADKCKNILASNWQGHLNTIKADAKGSKEDIYTSKVKYILRRGKPYIWVPEKDLHNVNTIIDERGSFAVSSPIPGPLPSLLGSMKKLPARVALTGDVEPLKDGKAQSATESLREVLLSEQKVISQCSYTVSGVLSSSNLSYASRSESLKKLLEGDEKYVVYKFNFRSSMFIDGNGGAYEVDFEDIKASKADPLAPFSAMLIDGINQNGARRRALILFCFIYLNAHARDAYMLSIDRKGFSVLGKVPSPLLKDGFSQSQWKEFRFTLKEEANDVETFCRQLVEMEEETVKKVSSYSGLQ
ncbi:hypothetical protein I3843_01G276700 [Carya illinoinensis]|uniref:FMN-binding split barrel n=1 Tax=Carya illinoinensis TaxID=32201 RepID=A0A8T1RRK0_CARIL|nr:uncharacterized protein LOC122290863 isoform X2 [Carya illinoinensis]KAG2730235.1 hypothetical protein I3760_01G282400 [Carya illinoinensis]KAG2730236.1 hypothetical protein I3760_01G282400 [Carya illinoinensis]KAG6620565.1 hypothetical protein I3842_Q061900 [Carya illinoinensis]KAG6620566.1 hypothetical protein I3842_Q061900 [Carya illinoinensis]KAG6620567.1 hypothetical protein I3842_Q061900 [Carya illinoinensis]